MSEEQTLTEKQGLFLEALMGEARGDIRSAMRLAGYSDTTKLGTVVGPLRDQIVDRASMVLALNAPKAAFGMIDVLEDPNTLGARNSISAAREILDRTGLIKKEKIEVTGATGGIFILPPKQNHDEEEDDIK